MVSLRDGALKLLGLRGKLLVDGQVFTEVPLRAPMQVALSANTRLDILEVHVPDTLLCISHPDLGRQPLTGTVSLRGGTHLAVWPGSTKEAEAILWTDGERWVALMRDGREVPLEGGTSLDVGGHELAVMHASPREAGGPTNVEEGTIEVPLHIRVRYETVHIHHREGEAPVVLDGQVAHIVSDLATAGVPVAWQVLAREIWPAEADVVVLRRNWDAALARLRRKLREHRVRADLVRADRNGNFELFLRRQDKVVDET
jgi:hypothetical protein